MRVLLLIIMTLILGYGCTAKKLAIDNADTLISYQVRKHLPLDSTQKKVFHQDLVDFLNDSKPLAKEITSVVKQIDLKEAKDIDKHYALLEKEYLKMANDFTKILAKPMSHFDPGQQGEFFQILEKENRDITSKKKDRHKRVADRLKHFLGSVTPDQLTLINNYREYSQERAEQRVKRREKLQTQFKNIFALQVSVAEKEKMIQKAFEDYQKESLMGNKNLEMIHALIPTLTSEQHKYFSEKKEELIQLLEYFIKKTY